MKTAVTESARLHSPQNVSHLLFPFLGWCLGNVGQKEMGVEISIGLVDGAAKQRDPS